MNELMEELSRKPYIIVSGKGGVGKTTFSASLGLRLADMGKKTLVVSIDPAHSLGDAFDKEIGSSVKKIKKRLYGLEFDPLQLFAAEKEVLRKLVSSEAGPKMGVIPMDEEMLDLLIDTQLPYEYAEGIGFMKLFHSLIEEKEYDVVIFDTAPTGHTLELLKLPEFLDSFYGKMIKFRLKISKFISRIRAIFGFGKDDRAETALKVLEETRNAIKSVRTVLTDPMRTEFIVVMIPNEMSILESIRLVSELEAHNIPNTNIIVNFVRIYHGNCDFCNVLSDYHLRQLRKIKETFPENKLWVIPYVSEEIRGLDKLGHIGNFIGSLSIEDAIDKISAGEVIE